jgi:tetratricopeptide (TPR) repeat protein
MRKGFYIILLSLTVICTAQGQKRVLDSLWKVWNNKSIQDSDRLFALYKLSFQLQYSNPDSGIILANLVIKQAQEKHFKRLEACGFGSEGDNYEASGKYKQSLEAFQKSIKLFEETGNKEGLVNTLCDEAITYSDLAEYSNALNDYMKSLKIAKEINDKAGIADDLGNIGIIYTNIGDYPKALEFKEQSLKMQEQLGNKQGIADGLENIGALYEELSDYYKALSYEQRSLKILQELGNKRNIAAVLSNIGSIYKQLAVYAKALSYHQQSLEVDKEIENKGGMANDLGNIGSVYEALADYKKAIDYYNQSMQASEAIGDKQEMTGLYSSFGSVYTKMKDWNRAMQYAGKAFDTAKKIGSLSIERDALNELSTIYANQGRYKESLEKYQEYITMRDSILNDSKRKEIAHKEMQIEYERKATADSVKNAEAGKVKDAQIKAQQSQQYALYVVLLLVFVFSGFIYNRFRVTQKQKTIIEEKKQEVDNAYGQLHEKHKEITDSINYAKRIQVALLKEEEHISLNLPEHFILFKSRDVVSGDFYWSFEKENCWYIAAVDCTGHGVPGAFLTMLGSAFLNEICASGILSPAEILNRLREKIVQELSGQGEVKDGMDISLCSISLIPINEGGDVKVQWAGANNPLWYLEDGKMKEKIADKQPIGYQEGQRPFTNHSIELSKGSTIYLFTDGYADQFGGPKGKNLNISNCKNY